MAAILFSSSMAVNWPLVIAGDWMVYLIPLVAIFYYVRSFERGKKFWPSVGVRRKNLGKGLIWALAIFTVLFIVLAVYNQVATRLIGESPGEKTTEYFEQTYPDWYFVYFFFASFIPVGLFEETIFRGFVLDRLRVKGVLFAILLSSALHSSLHLWYAGALGVTGMALYGSAFILFAFFALAYIKSGNILGLVLLHGLNNATLSVRHFFGSRLVGAIWLSVILIGALCIGYLMYGHFRKRLGS